METSEKTVLDYCKDITLHNNQLLICVEGTVSTMQLNTLASEKGQANSTIIDKFFKDLAKNDKVIVKTSKKVKDEYPDIASGDYVVFNGYGNPNAIFVSNDPFELDNVIDNFRHDSKDIKFTTTLTSQKYKVRCYYTFEASSIILTKRN